MNSKFITNKGSRKSNQDVVFIKNLGENNKVFLLADGMGGYKNGGYAADFIVAHLYKGLNTIENFDRNSIQADPLRS